MSHLGSVQHMLCKSYPSRYPPWVDHSWKLRLGLGCRGLDNYCFDFVIFPEL